MKQRFMTFVILLSCIASFNGISFAKGDDYCCDFISIGNPFQCITHATEGHIGDHGNCTWYCAYRRPDVIGICRGNASEWFEQAKAGGLSTGQDPEIGAIAVFHYFTWINKVWTDVGHVAYIEALSQDGYFYVSEMGYESWNCLDNGHNFKKRNKNSIDGLVGFILPPNKLFFDFSNHSADGFVCGSDTEALNENYGDMIGFKATGGNPRIESPSFSCGLRAEDFVILVKAGIAGLGEINGAKAYLYDQLGSWDNQVNLSPVDISDLSIKKWFDQESGTTNETCFQANAGFVCLSERNFQFLKADFADVARPSLEVKKFSLELSNRTGDFQFLDDVIICSKAKSWDFEDSQLGWTIVKEARNCDHPFYPEDATAPTHYWRMEATGGYSTIESPFLYSSDSADTMIGMRYSIRPKKLQDQPVVLQKLPDAHVVFIYDNGNGYNKDAQVSHKLIPRNGETQNVVLDIPPEFQGKIVRFKIALTFLFMVKYSDQ